MELLWLPFSVATIIIVGFGQVFAKETRTATASSNLLLLLGAHMFALMMPYWLLMGDATGHDVVLWLQAAAAALLSAAAYISYYEALKHGKISIVGTIAGAYAPWTVVLALLFLGESLSLGEAAGISLVVASMLVFTYSADDNGDRKTELRGIALALVSFFLWGTSAVVAKGAISEIGNTNFVGVFGIVVPSTWLFYWLLTTKGRFETPKTNLRVLELSMFCLAAGAVTIYMAFENGPVSIVSPVSNTYPIVTIAVAKVRLKERLSGRQLVALAMLLASIPLFSL